MTRADQLVPKHAFLRWNFRPMLSALAVIMTSLASPCLNDRDSLDYTHTEQVDILTGYFRRHTNEYYQSRINRILLKAKTGGLTLGDYDDLSVAYDRIHKDDEAITWINRKIAYLSTNKAQHIMPRAEGDYDPYNRKLSYDAYHRYSAEANLGTFIIHKWFQDGRPQSRKGDIELSLQHLRKAVEINPEAHSGREWAQIALIEHIEDPQNVTFPSNVSESEQMAGILGLVELGSAWNSPDIFVQYMKVSKASEPSLAYLAYLRAKELVDSGAKLSPGLQLTKPAIDSEDEERLSKAYQSMRKKSELFQEAFQDFERSRLRGGNHPDSDKGFYDDFKRERDPLPVSESSRRTFYLDTLWGILLYVGLPITGIYFISRWIKGELSNRPPT